VRSKTRLGSLMEVVFMIKLSVLLILDQSSKMRSVEKTAILGFVNA
jgi:hypothetical protein